MPKKFMKVSKSKKVVAKSSQVHQSFRHTPHHTDEAVKKYGALVLAVVVVVFGIMLYKSILVSPDINMVGMGSSGLPRNVGKCPSGYTYSATGKKCIRQFPEIYQQP